MRLTRLLRAARAPVLQQPPHLARRITRLCDVLLGQLGIPLGHPDVRMTENLGQLIQIPAVHHVPRGEAVSQVMEAEVLQARQLQYRLEGLIDPLTTRAATWRSQDPLLPDHRRVAPELVR